MSIPLRVINLTIDSSDSESIRPEKKRRATKRKAARISEEELQQLKQKCDEQRKRRRQNRYKRKYIRTAESFLTTDYRRKLAADIQEYAKQMKAVWYLLY